MSEDRTIAQMVLRRALDAIEAGAEKHGDARMSFQMIGELWTVYLGHVMAQRNDKTITALEVSVMMSLMKIARAAYSFEIDNYVDEAGYTALAAMLNPKNAVV